MKRFSIGLVLIAVLMAQDNPDAKPKVQSATSEAVPPDVLREFDHVTDQWMQLKRDFDSEFGDRQMKIQQLQLALNEDVKKKLGPRNDKIKADFLALKAKTEAKYCRGGQVLKEQHEGHNDWACSAPEVAAK